MANFSYTGAGNPAPCSVSFTNTSQNATSYNWDFGDNGTSTDVNPNHTYTTGGTFTVTLVATGTGGSNTIQKTVNILNPTGPTASFTYSGAGGYAPCLVSFNNTSQNATSYSWNFGDGGTSSATNPSHTFTSGGTFTVQLTATGTGGSNTTSQTVNILAPPTKCYIKKVYIVAIPWTDGSGAGWDSYNGPDLYYNIENYGGTVYHTESANWFTDAVQSDLPISWTFNSPYLLISNLSEDLYFGIFDHDSPDADDFIGWSSPIKLSTYTTYPTSITKTNTSNGVTVKIDIQWSN